MLSLLTNFAQYKNCSGAETVDCLSIFPSPDANQTALTSFLSLTFGVLAAVAVIMIIIQGIKFATSQGDPQKAADARKSIIYAIIGLAIALSAEIIVRFVINRI